MANSNRVLLPRRIRRQQWRGAAWKVKGAVPYYLGQGRHKTLVKHGRRYRREEQPVPSFLMMEA